MRAAALGEAMYGAGRGHDCFAYVTIGTGISYCLVQGGVPYRGARGNALVLASGPISHTCPHCGERSAMVVEHYSSGPAIARRYGSGPAAMASTGHDVIGAARADDPLAIEIVSPPGPRWASSSGFS